MEERKSWEQMEGESLTWFRRFTRFRLMEIGRSVAAVYHQEKAQKSPEKPRGNPGKEWYEASNQWKWEERAADWDASQTEEQERIIAQEKEKILRTGYALMHKRVQILNELSELLIEEAKEKQNMYLSGPKETRFNDGLYASIDKYLNSIAAEMGERVKKKDISIKELPPNVYIGFDPDQDGIEDREAPDEDETDNGSS